MQHLLAGTLIEFHDFRHVFSDQIHVLHGQNRQFKTAHTPHLTRPKTSGINHVFSIDGALIGEHIPSAVSELDNVLDFGVQLDGGTVFFRRLCIGMRGAVRIQVALPLHRTERQRTGQGRATA